MIFKKGQIVFNNNICGDIVNFSLVQNNNTETMSFDTERNYSFSVTMKLPLIDRIKSLFGVKTKLEKFVLLEGYGKYNWKERYNNV